MDENRSPRTVLVTGGTSGVGMAVARRFAGEGWNPIILARHREDLERVKADFHREGLKLWAFPCDVGDEGQVDKTLDEIYRKFSFVDLLVNNAGIGFKGPVEDLSPGDMDAMIATNLRGVFLMTRGVLPSMKKERRGYIINVASGAALNGIANMAGYCATKFAVRGFSLSVAQEARDYDVRVTVLCPGSINSSFHEKMGVSHPREKLEKMMQPEDIADTVFHVANQPLRYWVSEVIMRASLMGR